MKRFRIFHETEYQYHQPVSLGAHRLLVRPRDGHDVRIESSRLDISPASVVTWHRDELDNSVALVTFDEAPTSQLIITSEVTVAHYLSHREELPLTPEGHRVPAEYSDTEVRSLGAYRSTQSDSYLEGWLASFKSMDSLELLTTISEAIFNQLNYQLREEEGVQSPADTLQLRSGSCRDYAWLFVSAARHFGFAARFVSGYFHTAGTALADGATHAWTEIYLSGAGWTGFDPTCNRLTAENHVPVSVALNPEDVPPISGSYVGPAQTPNMNVRVNVVPVD